MKRILFVFIIVNLVSCKSHKYCSDALRAVQDSSALFSVARSVDTIYLHDSIYRQDSVIYRERTIHDTVYITKEVYRDSRRLNIESQKSTRRDTIHVVEYRNCVIEHPPERYVPKFYKWCTGLFLAISILLISYYVLRYWILN